ncbi:MAG: hypothetical protein HUJ27_08595 [Rhodobacteraceae bacterium]|nr:hypothetical protein [Paracoccaceae bacterium]
MSFLLRWLFAFVLIAATFNPTQWNYTRWAMNNYSEQLSITVLLGLILLVGYIIYLRATLRSIGAFGMGLVAAVVAALVWVMADLGLLSLENPTLNTWIAIFALSIVLGVGLSWSFVRRALSGQYDVDETDE